MDSNGSEQLNVVSGEDAYATIMAHTFPPIVLSVRSRPYLNHVTFTCKTPQQI